jgi:hypothetical protein
MEAVAHNPSFAKKAGVPQSVGKEFSAADKGKTFKRGDDMATKKMNPGMMAMMAKKKPMKMAAGGMPMKDGKPAFIGDGKGAMRKGGSVGTTKMGTVKTAAPSRDGVAAKGKTKGTMVKMNKGGKAC